MKCEAFTAKGNLCGRTARKLALLTGACGVVRKVLCGTHVKQYEAMGWQVGDPADDAGPGRGVSGWIMLPVHVTADLSGLGRIVETSFAYDMARVARDDFNDSTDMFEVAEPVGGDSPFWSGVAARDVHGQETEDMERPVTAERKLWETIVFNSLEAWIEEEEGTPLAAGWVRSDWASGDPS